MSLEKLVRGNRDYVNAFNNPGRISADVRVETAEHGQKPYAVIVTCSDSRVPPEHIFSAGIGELFVVRTAGNVVGDFERGTVEYAVGHLGVKLVVVMGHTHCGAVGAALHPHGEAPASLAKLVDEIKCAIGTEHDELEAVKTNIKHSISRLLESKALHEAAEARELMVVPALYDIHSGGVEFLKS